MEGGGGVLQNWRGGGQMKLPLQIEEGGNGFSRAEGGGAQTVLG